MRDNWKTVKILDIAEKVGMGPFGSSIKVSTFVDNGIPVISGQHLKKVYTEDFENNFITVDHADKLKNANVFRGDIVFTHAGNIGQVSFIPNNSKYKRYIISQRQFYLRCDRSMVDPIYLTYYFKSPVGQHTLLANTSSTGVPSISRPVSYLKTIKLILPPLPEQKSIVRILGSLDDKIELNRQMNGTLEEIVQAIFKAWFVDFEPFKDGNFVESELGQIPVGWKVGTVSSIIEINPKLPLKKGVIAQYVDMKGIPTSGPSVISKIYKEFNGGSKFQNKDILLARITPCLENGKTALVDFLSENEIGFGSTEFIVLREKGSVKSEFIYCLARNENFRKHCIASMVGSSGRQRVQLDCFNYYKIALPKNTLLEEFHKMTKPYFEIITQNQKEIETLTQTRDTLLPKLVTGDIGV